MDKQAAAIRELSANLAAVVSLMINKSLVTEKEFEAEKNKAIAEIAAVRPRSRGAYRLLAWQRSAKRRKAQAAAIRDSSADMAELLAENLTGRIR